MKIEEKEDKKKKLISFCIKLLRKKNIGLFLLHNLLEINIGKSNLLKNIYLLINWIRISWIL